MNKWVKVGKSKVGIRSSEGKYISEEREQFVKGKSVEFHKDV